MKKVLVLAAAVALFATPAFAVISGSAHDLSGAGTSTDRLCVYCHTPHMATTEAPLWNRTAKDLSGATKYNSATLDATLDYTKGDAKLCMTCHDGDATDQLTNLNGAASGVMDNTSGALTFSGAANLGTDFTNDHPVGFTYSAAGAGLKTGAAVNALLFSGDMWCSSCHQVHEPGTGSQSPFLRQSNSNSDLCLVCHAK